MRFLDYLLENGMSVQEYDKTIVKNADKNTIIPKELSECDCCVLHAQSRSFTNSNGNTFRMDGDYSLDGDYSPDYGASSQGCVCPCKTMASYMAFLIYDDIETLSDSETNSDSESLGEDSDLSEDSKSAGSLEDFIVEDEGFSHRERRKLNKVLKRNKKW